MGWAEIIVAAVIGIAMLMAVAVLVDVLRGDGDDDW